MGDDLDLALLQVEIDPIPRVDRRKTTAIKGLGNNVRDRDSFMLKRDTSIRDQNAR